MATQVDEASFVQSVIGELNRGRVTILSGAGVSTGAPAWLPNWSDMTQALLAEIAGPEYNDEAELFTPFKKYLFNEVVLQHLRIRLNNLKPAVEFLNRCLTYDGHNLSHAVMAWCAAHKGAKLLTTNFDMLIENAAGALGTSVSLPKLHGSLDSTERARFTVDAVLGPLEDHHNEAVQNAIVQCPVCLVVGYRGQDDFDVMPSLFESARELYLAAGSVDAYLALFMEFMNAYQAALKGVCSIDRLAPSGWKEDLTDQMVKAAQVYYAKHNYGLYATMIHNAGFVCQVLADLHLKEGDKEEAIQANTRALELFMEGVKFRLRLRDPRGLCQSHTRIGDAACFRAEIELDEQDFDEAESILNQYQVEDRIAEVRQHYFEIPYETLRLDELDKLSRRLAGLRERIQAQA